MPISCKLKLKNNNIKEAWCGTVVGLSHKTYSEVKHKPVLLVLGWVIIRVLVTNPRHIYTCFN